MLNEKSTYTDIKREFRANYRSLPETLVAGFKTYHDVKAFVVTNIKQVDGLGAKARKSKIGIASKRNLYELYTELNEAKH